MDDIPPYSIDIELLRPAFGDQGFAGVDVPSTARSGTVRYGTVLQYEQAPLTIYEAVEHVELGAVVTNRFSAMAGASIDVQRTTFSVLVPTALNWGTELETFGADGFGLGDVGANARVVVLQTQALNLGVRTGVVLPTGKRDAYMSEGRTRFGVGALGAVSLGELTLAGDFGLATRPTVRTREDFVASNEVGWGTALRYKLPDATRIGLDAQIVGRNGLTEFLQGGAENAIEALGGIEAYPSRGATLGLSVGRGLTEGYGTTDFRIVTSLVIEASPRERLPPFYPAERPPGPRGPVPITDDELVAPPPVLPPDTPVERQGDEIFIRDMVEFVVDTNVLQPYSEPTLELVADFLNADARIASVVIEGHASQEGDYAHNYALAESRARRIWEFLLAQGVAEARISYRGFGEVHPVSLGEDEKSLQENRRVRFIVTRQLGPDEPLPDYPNFQTLPWNGMVVPVVQPTAPAAPEPASEEEEFP